MNGSVAVSSVTWFEVSLMATLFSLLTLIVGYFIKNWHQQAMGKLDQMILQMQAMTTQMALHDQQLMVGSKEFAKIEAHQKEQDWKIEKIDKRLAIMESHKDG